MAATQYTADNYNPINIQKNPDDTYHQIGRFTCTQKFQGPGKTCRMTKVKSQILYKINSTEECTADSTGNLAFRIYLERGSQN